MRPTLTFEALQGRFARRLRGTTPEEGASTIVACPSLSFPEAELRKITGIQFYEERMLCLALLLRDESLRLVYPTSVEVEPAVVDYYLSWLPDPEGARRRLRMISVGDPRPAALTTKLLARPDLLAALRAQVHRPEASFVLPFNVTAGEARLAEELGLPLYGSHPDLAGLGSKSGARRVASEAGVAVFPGSEDLYSLAEIEKAVDGIRSAAPEAGAVVAKLNNGFSGQGNVILELADVVSPLQDSPAVFCAAEESWASFGPKVEREGAVVEELVRSPGTTSPSVQVRILPDARCEVISTHDQILGGPDGQVYLGCRFPARADYRDDIQQAALRVAGVLAARGVLGSFGIDFVVVPGRGVFLSEINLRLGGTTHPFLMARYVSGGTLAAGGGGLDVDGACRVYTATDNVKDARYQGLDPRAVVAAVAAEGLAYDPRSATGVTLHLLGALRPCGKVGLVCIAPTHAEADDLHLGVVRVLDSLAAGAPAAYSL